jgi:hypothetical protein
MYNNRMDNLYLSNTFQCSNADFKWGHYPGYIKRFKTSQSLVLNYCPKQIIGNGIIIQLVINDSRDDSIRKGNISYCKCSRPLVNLYYMSDDYIIFYCETDLIIITTSTLSHNIIHVPKNIRKRTYRVAIFNDKLYWLCNYIYCSNLDGTSIHKISKQKLRLNLNLQTFIECSDDGGLLITGYHSSNNHMHPVIVNTKNKISHVTDVKTMVFPDYNYFVGNNNYVYKFSSQYYDLETPMEIIKFIYLNSDSNEYNLILEDWETNIFEYGDIMITSIHVDNYNIIIWLYNCQTMTFNKYDLYINKSKSHKSA